MALINFGGPDLGDFDEFSRGDLITSGKVMAEVVTWGLRIANGAAPITTLRREVAGFHKGVRVGAIEFQNAIRRNGEREKIAKLILDRTLTTILVVLSDDTTLTVEGIVGPGAYSGGEGHHVVGQYTLAGRITIE